MNQDVIQGKWAQIKGDAKTFFGKLTDDDMMQVQGNSEKMIGKLQERYGYTREQAEAEWGKFSKSIDGKLNSIKDSADALKDNLKGKIDEVKGNLKSKI